MTEGLASSTQKSTNIGTVLVPIDFSDESHQALRYASALVRELRANCMSFTSAKSISLCRVSPGREQIRSLRIT